MRFVQPSGLWNVSNKDQWNRCGVVWYGLVGVEMEMEGKGKKGVTQEASLMERAAFVRSERY